MFKVISDDIKNQIVLLRVDFNVPIVDGAITDYSRVNAVKPTIDLLLKNGNRVLILSHLGRPSGVDESLSLKILLPYIEQQYGRKVQFCSDYLDGVAIESDLVLLENIRFHSGEEKNDPDLSQKLAGLADIIVVDAFATAHRKASSTYGALLLAPSYAGLLLAKEVSSLTKILTNPSRPVLAVVGGSKVSTKLPLIENLLNAVDTIIVGGGIANTFLAGMGYNVGKSLYEPDFLEISKKLYATGKILLPVDVVVSSTFTDSTGRMCSLDSIKDEMILDIGTSTLEHYRASVNNSKSILVNGPVGVFELSNYSAGTRGLFEIICQSNAFKVAGGGDTISAIETFGMCDKFDYVSTAGGAFLEFVEGKVLPTIEALASK